MMYLLLRMLCLSRHDYNHDYNHDHFVDFMYNCTHTHTRTHNRSCLFLLSFFFFYGGHVFRFSFEPFSSKVLFYSHYSHMINYCYFEINTFCYSLSLSFLYPTRSHLVPSAQIIIFVLGAIPFPFTVPLTGHCSSASIK